LNVKKKIAYKIRMVNMKNPLFLVLMTGIILFASCSENSKNKSTENKKDSTELIGVYYFHGKNRCKTCIAVGNISKNTVKKYFGNDKAVVFHEVNVELDSNKDISNEFQVRGSGLSIKYREKNGMFKEDLTELAFLNALTNPDTVENTLKAKIEAILKVNRETK
jgi:hypothetical protein